MKLLNRFLTIIFSIGFIPVIPIFIMLFYYQSVNRESVLNYHENMADMSAGMAGEAVYRLSSRLGYLDLIRKNFSKDSEFLAYCLENNQDFVLASLLNSEGVQKIREGAVPFKRLVHFVNISGEPYFVKIKRDKLPKIGDFRMVSDIPAATLVYPLSSGEYLYVVSDLRGVFKNIYSRKKLGRVYFSNSRGEIFGSDGFSPSINSGDLAKMLSAGKGRIPSLPSSEGEFVGAFARIADLDLFALALQDKSEAYRQINLITSTVVFFVLSLLTVFYFISLFAAANISEPINRLIEGAERIGRGIFSGPVPESGKIKEISVLISAFNSMMKEMEKYHNLHIEKIMDEKKKLEMLMTSINEGIILSDFCGRPIYLNAAAISFLSSSSASAQTAKKINEIVRLNSKEKGRGLSFSWAPGRNYDAAIKVLKPLREAPFILIVLRDVTIELNIQKMKEDFFHSIAHDLRAPILNMQGYIKLLGYETPPEKKKEYLDGLKEESERIFRMLENILDMSRLESGAVKLNLDKTELGAFLKKAGSRYEYLMREKKISYSVSIPEKEIFFSADSELLERAVDNLLSNAFKFTPENGIIRLEGEASEESVLIRVYDSGPGISGEKISLIFDKFRSYDKKGFGLGLSIAKAIAELHGGKIYAKSEEGSGSIFTVEIKRRVVNGN